jgi:hypothetical protein
VGIGFEQAIGLCLKIIPLSEVNQVQGAGNGQAAETILAFQDGIADFIWCSRKTVPLSALRTSSMLVSSALDRR